MKQLLRRTCRSLYCIILYLINLFYHICVQFHPNPLRTGLSLWTTEDSMSFPRLSHVFPWCHPPWWRLLEAGPRDRGVGLLKDSHGFPFEDSWPDHWRVWSLIDELLNSYFHCLFISQILRRCKYHDEHVLESDFHKTRSPRLPASFHHWRWKTNNACENLWTTYKHEIPPHPSIMAPFRMLLFHPFPFSAILARSRFCRGVSVGFPWALRRRPCCSAENRANLRSVCWSWTGSGK